MEQPNSRGRDKQSKRRKIAFGSKKQWQQKSEVHTEKLQNN
jgi:hypothetical protein